MKNEWGCDAVHSSTLYPGKLTAGPSLKSKGALCSMVSSIKFQVLA